jgi:hypothetical protein
VKLLQRLLKLQAALWFIGGFATLAAPAWVLEGLLGQPPLSQYAWVRAGGVMAAVLALLMVLVSQKIEDLWWWSWAFAVLEVGVATVFAMTALIGLPEGAAAWPWWLLAAVNGALGAGLLVGMGLAGQEKPFV